MAMLKIEKKHILILLNHRNLLRIKQKAPCAMCKTIQERHTKITKR